jgi:hypothetical protein
MISYISNLNRVSGHSSPLLQNDWDLGWLTRPGWAKMGSYLWDSNLDCQLVPLFLYVQICWSWIAMTAPSLLCLETKPGWSHRGIDGHFFMQSFHSVDLGVFCSSWLIPKQTFQDAQVKAATYELKLSIQLRGRALTKQAWGPGFSS